MSEGLSDFLNFARWWAAFAVLLGHARSILFVDYHMIESPGFGDDLFYFLSGFGYEAVLIFFVMSGFLVGGKALEKIRDADFSIKLYAVDRFSRLYSVYVLALILTYLCDSLGGYFFAESKLYGGELQGVIAAIDGSFTERHSWPIFFGNLFMLQTIVVPTFGSNGPLWSLANESVYYILGPISFMALFWLRGAKRAIGISVIFVCLVSLPFGIAYGFIIWLAGAVFVYSGKSHWLFLPVGFGLLLGSLVVVRIDIGIPQYVCSLFISLSFLVIMSGFQGMEIGFPLKKTWKFLADFSYSLYLLHFPVVLLFAACLFGLGKIDFAHRLLPSLSSYFYLFCAVCIAILVAWLLSLISEAETVRFKAKIRQFIGIS